MDYKERNEKVRYKFRQNKLNYKINDHANMKIMLMEAANED